MACRGEGVRDPREAWFEDDFIDRIVDALIFFSLVLASVHGGW